MTSLLEHYESEITFAIPTNLDLQAMEFPNVTVLLSGMDDLDFNQLTQNMDYNTEADYNRFMGDVWVGIVLTLMIVTSIFCMCACFLFHKFKQWKASVSHFQNAVATMDSESADPDSAYDSESLPSYTLVSGLPSYDDALECYRKAQVSGTPRPSLMKLFSFDNSLLSTQMKDAANSSGELQQVVVVENKDGLPSYQETVVNEKRRGSSNIKRTVHKPMLPIKFKDLSNDGHSNASTPSSAGGDEEGLSESLMAKFNSMYQRSKKADVQPQLHKSPSLVLVYDDEYWKNVHQQQERVENDCGCKLTHSYSSNSLPRNFSRPLMSEC